MLTLYYSAKGTEYRNKLYSAFAKDIKQGKNSLLLVPEQFTVHAEKQVYSLAGSFSGNCEVVSFKRLCYRILFFAGRLHSSRLDGAGQAAVMYRAVRELENELEYFGAVRVNSAFIASLLDFRKELSRCEVSPLQLIDAQQKMQEGRTRKKLHELSLILSVYDGILNNLGESADSEMASAKKALEDTDSFNGFHIYIDGFHSFSPEEYGLLSRLMSRCDITVSLFTPDLRDTEGGYGLFSDVKATAYTLKTMADEAGVKTEEYKVDDEDYYKSEVLGFIANNVFRNRAVFDGDTSGLTLFHAPDPYGEAVYAASRIKELVRREDFSYNDFAVLVRDENSYKGVIDSVFSVFDIPVFADKRTPLAVKPPVLFIKTALQIVSGRFTTDDVLIYAKTGLAGLNGEMVAKLQRYCNIWDVPSAQWFAGPFKNNPNGFTSEKDEKDDILLNEINGYKEILIAPLVDFKKNLKGSSKDMCRAITEFIKAVKLPEKLSAQAELLRAAGEYGLCQESEQSYEIFIRAVEQVYLASDDREMTPAEFADLFLGCLSFYDIGRIPTSLDEVIFGTPDRLKSMGKKCVFLLGVNDGVFPKSIPDNGLVNDGDRTALLKLGIELDSIADEKMFKERFYAYCAFTLPEKYLFVTCAGANGDEQELPPSYYMTMLEELCRVKPEYEDKAPLQDKSLLFSLLIRDGFKDEKLLQFFENDPRYQPVLESARAFSDFGKTETAHSERLSNLLTGKGLSASPSRLDTYFSCRFAHFCKYVLGLRPDRQAHIDAPQVGTFIHHGLEVILRDFAQSGVDFKTASREDIEKKIDEITAVYLEGYLGGCDDKTDRFITLFNRLKDCLGALVLRLCDEFSRCSFHTVDMELSIGDNGEIPAMDIDFGEGHIRISGKADRVDMFTDETGNYVRVVDYKTGGKDFHMADIFNGINLQMLLYLFSICENGRERYGSNPHPAGILYYPADEPVLLIARNETKEKINSEKMSKYNQKGLILKDLKIVEAMDDSLQGRYLPFALKKDGEFDKRTSHVTTEFGFEAIKKHIAELIKGVGKEMLKGDVTPNPFKCKKNNSCQFCDYAPICGYEPIRGGREYNDYDNSELKKEVDADD